MKLKTQLYAVMSEDFLLYIIVVYYNVYYILSVVHPNMSMQSPHADGHLNFLQSFWSFTVTVRGLMIHQSGLMYQLFEKPFQLNKWKS